jgi:hypothetical protein
MSVRKLGLATPRRPAGERARDVSYPRLRHFHDVPLGLELCAADQSMLRLERGERALDVINLSRSTISW